jgi:hypothetical protein
MGLDHAGGARQETCRWGMKSPSLPSNPQHVRTMRGLAYYDGVCGVRVKFRFETPARGSFGHPGGALLEPRTPRECQRNCLLVRWGITQAMSGEQEWPNLPISALMPQ